MAERFQFGDDGTHSYGKKPVGVLTEFTEHGYPRQIKSNTAKRNAASQLFVGVGLPRPGRPSMDRSR